MKKILLTLLIFGIAVASFAQEEEDIVYEKAFKPMLPEIMAQGGSFTAVAEGYGSLFTNPAGFASERKDFTIVAANPWIYVRPDKVLEAFPVIEGLISEGGGGDDAAINPGEMITLLGDQAGSGENGNNGFGLGVSAGLGWAGGGLGLGVIGVVDMLVGGGDTLTGASGDVTATIGVIGGLAIPFNLGPVTLRVGADVRPMVRLHSTIEGEEVANLVSSFMGGAEEGFSFDSLMNDLNAYFGLGFGLDAGAILDIGPFAVGLSVRDIATEFTYSYASLSSQLDALTSGMFPEETTDLNGNPVDTRYVVPMEICVGAAFHPDLGGLSTLIDPKVHVDLKDPIGVIRDGKSPWTLLHIGGEVKVLRIFNVRAGFNQGYLTLGAGIELPGIWLNVATFSRELGKRLGDAQNSGVTLEAAIRF